MRAAIQPCRLFTDEIAARTPIKPTSPKSPKELKPPSEPTPGRRQLAFTSTRSRRCPRPSRTPCGPRSAPCTIVWLIRPSMRATVRQFEEASAALAAAQADVVAAEKWLELEILREEVAGG